MVYRQIDLYAKADGKIQAQNQTMNTSARDS